MTTKGNGAQTRATYVPVWLTPEQLSLVALALTAANSKHSCSSDNLERVFHDAISWASGPDDDDPYPDDEEEDWRFGSSDRPENSR